MFLLKLIIFLVVIGSSVGMFYRILQFKEGKVTGEGLCGKKEWDRIKNKKDNSQKIVKS